MSLPEALSNACRQGRLGVLWGDGPFSLAAQPPARRALLLNRWLAAANTLPLPTFALPQLPPLPLLSLDPTGRVEQAFTQSKISLQVIHTRRDVPARGQHALLKLAGDLDTRQGLVLSRPEIRELHSDPDKQHLLAELRRRVDGGALLLLGCDPANEDFQAWWSLLAATLDNTAFFALGEPAAAWPAGVVCLELAFEALNTALWAAQPGPEVTEPPASSQPPASAEAKYVINLYGPVKGLTVGDKAQVEQYFGQSTQTVQGDWEALMTQLTGRLETLSTQLDQGIDDLKRGQLALYRQVDQAYRSDLARILAAVQQGQLEQGELRATLTTLRRAMHVALNRGLPMDPELRAAIANLTEAVESSLSLERKLELTLPLLPLLSYKIELGVGSELDLHDLWAELQTRWKHLIERFGS